MKKVQLTFVIVLLLVLALSPLGAQSAPIDEDALNAFGVSFQAYLVGTMMFAFGQAMPGFEIEESDGTAVATFRNMSLASLQMEESFGYTHISGTIEAYESGDDADMVADLRFTGGPVTNLKWTVEDYNMTEEDEVVTFTIIADGKKHTLRSDDMTMGY